MNKTNCKCEGCINMGIWGHCRYCNTELECENNKEYKSKYV